MRSDRLEARPVERCIVGHGYGALGAERAVEFQNDHAGRAGVELTPDPKIVAVDIQTQQVDLPRHVAVDHELINVVDGDPSPPRTNARPPEAGDQSFGPFRTTVHHQTGPATVLSEKAAVPPVGPSSDLNKPAVGLTHQLDQRERDAVLLVL
ncbi:MAG TPA: hypothetical protein DEQ98_12425, partial [Acidobacteria bacterium]|nr:hypothetical protein [Acidobacteriota bacterium]